MSGPGKSLFVVALSALASLIAANASAQVGAPYRTREPISCESRAGPASGAPSNAQAVQYVICTVEGIGDGRVYLLEDVSVEVAAESHTYDPDREYLIDIDAAHPVYPITGSLVRYACETVNAENDGRNCERFVEANAKGACYRDISGGWRCTMSDLFQRKTGDVTGPQ